MTNIVDLDAYRNRTAERPSDFVVPAEQELGSRLADVISLTDYTLSLASSVRPVEQTGFATERIENYSSEPIRIIAKTPESNGSQLQLHEYAGKIGEMVTRLRDIELALSHRLVKVPETNIDNETPEAA